MPIYVDGFNAIHTLGLVGEKKAQIELLIEMLSQRFPNQIAHIFLDGFPTQIKSSSSSIRLHFSLDKTADEHILTFLKKKTSSSIFLFTNDQDLGNKAKVAHQLVQVLPINQLKQNSVSSSKKNKKEIKVELEKNTLAPDSQWFSDLYLIKHNIKKK